MRVVDETLAHARSHPQDYQLTADQIQLLAQDFVDGESHLPADHPITQQLQNQIIQVMVNVLNHFVQDAGSRQSKGKHIMEYNLTVVYTI